MGPKPDQARLAMILVHGRGASAEDIMGLAREFRQTDVAYLAPQAAGNTWYPYSFLTPMEKNEPALSSALGVLKGLVSTLGEQGVPAERVGLLGFSQGACLSALPEPPVNIRGQLPARSSSWDAATSTRTSRSNVCRRRPRSFVAWAQSSMSASTVAWGTR
jgi:hypothetical protein